MTTVISKYEGILHNTSENDVTISTEDLKSLMALAARKKGPKKGKKEKDPNRPKRPMSAYFFFKDSDVGRDQFKQAHPEHFDEETGKVKNVQLLAKFTSKVWKEMSDEAKDPFNSMASKAKDGYTDAMREYQPTARIVIPEADVPEAPDGWSGPFKGYYCSANANGKKTYTTLADAIEIAQDMDDCMGITRNAKGKYSLRKMDGGRPFPTEKGDISWTKGDCELQDEVTIVEAPTNQKSKKTKHVTIMSPTNELTPSKTGIYEASTDDEFDPEDNGADPVGDSCSEEDVEEENGESAEVEAWIYKGINYLVDPSDGTVYDSDKFKTDGAVVEIGTREPNSSDGIFVPQ